MGGGRAHRQGRAALAGIAAENLEQASGIAARTLASWEYAWERGNELLSKRDVLVIDEAGLVGTRQLAGVLERAETAGAKVVLVGDPEQLQAIEAGAPFRGIAAQAGMVELTEVRRQSVAWQREATQHLAKGRTGEALASYEREKRIWAAPTREAARHAMLKAWQRAAVAHPHESRLMLAYTHDDVAALNVGARALCAAQGELGRAEKMETFRGEREFAAGDRIYFLKNDRVLGVKNGSLGTVEKIRDSVLTVRLDGKEKQHRVVFDAREYPHLEYGYAATVYKAQGTIVDRTYVLASQYFDRHSTYVALSRHREAASLFYGREDFQPEWGRATVEDNFRSVLSRARPKELAHDYLEPGVAIERANLIEQWQREAVETWREYREKQKAAAAELERVTQQKLERSRAHGRDYSLDGPEL